MKKFLSGAALVLVLTVVFTFGYKYFNTEANAEVPKDVQLPVEPVEKPMPEIKVEGTPITVTPPMPTEPEIVEDEKGNQEIIPVIPKEPVQKEEPKTVVDVPAEPEKKPEAPVVTEPKPEPKPEVKPQPESKPEPKPSQPQDGDRRVVNGQKQVYIDGFGWLEDNPGGTSEYVDGTGNGNIIGH